MYMYYIIIILYTDSLSVFWIKHNYTILLQGVNKSYIWIF